MQDSAGLLIDAGDNPPENIQLTITNANRVKKAIVDLQSKKDKQTRLLDTEGIRLGKDLTGKDLTMDQFRFTTPLFTAVVPQAPYGTSMKDFLEEGPIAPGTYSAVVDGYFVMIKFQPPKEAAVQVKDIGYIPGLVREGRLEDHISQNYCMK